MVGAYQEILGDLHNLFGDTNSLDAVFAENGELLLQNTRKGDSIEQVLNSVGYSREMMVSAYQSQLQASTMSLTEQQHFVDQYRKGLNQVTYLEPRQKAAQ